MPDMSTSLLGRLLRRTPPRGWLVMELDDKAVRLAHVRQDEAKPVVEFAEKRQWDPAQPKSLERVVREFGVRGFPCITLLRPADYQIFFVEAPPVKREEMKLALRWRIKDMLEYPVDEAAIDVLELPLSGTAAQRPPQVYAVAARKEAVRATIGRFEKAGIAVSVVDIPDTAQRNLAALFGEPEEAVGVLTFDRDGALITVSFRGELYLSRRLDVTSDQLVDSVGKYHASSDDNLVLEEDEGRGQLFERVLVEVQRSIDACERSFPFFSVGRVLVGSVPEEAGLLAHLAGNLYLPAEPLDLAQVLRLPASSAAWPAAERGRFLKLIGAGLRPEEKIH
jgi:MSHA biogenesis protein MshI